MNKDKINEDLTRERANCTFDIKEMTHFIDGGPPKTAERKERERIMLSEKEFFEGVPEEYLDHKEKYENAVKKSVVIFGLVRRLQEEGKMVLNNYRDLIGGLLGSAATRDGSPLGLHYIMFMPALLSQGTEEQQSHWLPRAFSCSIIGSYAQTELGHGTFIRGLETTATYDPQTKEFILHSPTLTSYKWWPGGLGHTANYCIVVAQLYTKGKCHGIHSFLVQTRDEDTHMPLKGIKVGDIGAKLGLNSVNNGFLGFDHVRIPRDHMLMKHAQVLEDGTYVKSRHSKLNYGAMVFVRVVIVFDMVNYLSKAATIAVRYSAVRRQGFSGKGNQESQVLDYTMQQHKLLICVSACHALRITGNKLWDTFLEVSDQLTGGNLERLPELHALACCLKAVSTSDTAFFVERCRLACGGVGYMQSTNLPLVYGQVTAACTYEGDNTVLLLQTARFLVKTWQNMDTIELTPTVAYLKRRNVDDNHFKFSVHGIIRAFEIVAARKIEKCVESIQRRINSGLSMEDAWNMTSVQLAVAAEAHCRVVILTTFHEEANKKVEHVSKELKIVVNQLVELYVYYWALEKLNDLLVYTYISSHDLNEMQLYYERLLMKIRVNAVGLVDAFDIPDEILASTIGAYDGRVYERLMEEALKSPLNKDPNDSFHKYIKQIMRSNL